MLGQYAVMQMVVAATALVRNKIIAVRLGPSAFGDVAQIGAVVAAVVSFTSFGMQVSLSRNVARAQTRGDRQACLANANGLVLSLSLLATAAIFALLFFGDLLTVVGLPDDRDVLVAASLFFAAIPLLGIQTNYLSFLQGLLDVKGLATQRSLAVLTATALCVPLVWILGLVGAGATFLILNLLLALLLGLRCRSLGYDWLAVRLNRQVIGVLAAFGLVSMVAG
jgi:O-antigen/teichoic acid export membrane protein